MELIEKPNGRFLVRADGATIGSLEPLEIGASLYYRMRLTWKGKTVELASVTAPEDRGPHSVARLLVDEYRRRCRKESEVAR